MTSTWTMTVALALLASAACAQSDTANETANGNAAMPANQAAEAPNASVETTNATDGTPASGSILAWSAPADGSIVSAPDNLVLHFSPPARLAEVTVTGPEGAMPMMVTAAGEVEHYELPLSGLGPGSYSVSWRATAAGKEHQGDFSFTVR